MSTIAIEVGSAAVRLNGVYKKNKINVGSVDFESDFDDLLHAVIRAADAAGLGPKGLQAVVLGIDATRKNLRKAQDDQQEMLATHNAQYGNGASDEELADMGITPAPYIAAPKPVKAVKVSPKAVKKVAEKVANKPTTVSDIDDLFDDL